MANYRFTWWKLDGKNEKKTVIVSAETENAALEDFGFNTIGVAFTEYEKSIEAMEIILCEQDIDFEWGICK